MAARFVFFLCRFFPDVLVALGELRRVPARCLLVCFVWALLALPFVAARPVGSVMALVLATTVPREDPIARATSVRRSLLCFEFNFISIPPSSSAAATAREYDLSTHGSRFEVMPSSM
jgi:hypothetical protein